LLSLPSPVSPTNKTDHYNITEILLKVALNTIPPNTQISDSYLGRNPNKNLLLICSVCLLTVYSLISNVDNTLAIVVMVFLVFSD
jgi:hypothetical protein